MKTNIFSKQRFFIYTTTIFSLILSCKGAFENEKFTLIKTPYTGKELRIDGYYYKKYILNTDYNDIEHVDVIFLYKNGIVILAGSGNQLEFESYFSSGQFYDKVKSNPNVWGLYCIEGDTIKIECLKPMGGIGAPMYTKIGIILNDTTFRLVREFASYNIDDSRELDETFHFKQFAPKPDSTNVYTK